RGARFQIDVIMPSMARFWIIISAVFCWGCDTPAAEEFTALLPSQHDAECDPRASPPQIWQSGQEGMLCGVLGRTASDFLVSLEPGELEFLTVRSTGGDGILINTIVEQINSKAIAVAFDGICISACVELYVGANKAVLRERAIFVAHSTLGYRLELIRRTAEWAQAEHRAVADVGAEFERSFQLAATIPWRFHLESTALVEPICAGAINDGVISLVANGRTAFESTHQYWLPLAETLQRWRGDDHEQATVQLYDETLPDRMVAQWSFVGGMNLRHPLPDSQVILEGEKIARSTIGLCVEEAD
ncbi:hypothetical protein, partial [Hyphomonas sp.]